MANRSYYIYIITNKNNSVLYIGVTNNLERRISEHKESKIPGFSKEYNVAKLVYSEEYPDSMSAIRREKQLKNWRRAWKIDLIKKANPEFRDLYCEHKDPESSSG